VLAGGLTGLTGISCAVLLLPLLAWLIALKGLPLSGTTLTVMTFASISEMLAYGQ
jgi:uncharacterized membrane protein YfcA